MKNLPVKNLKIFNNVKYLKKKTQPTKTPKKQIQFSFP